jgi:hypothetical protein
VQNNIFVNKVFSAMEWQSHSIECLEGFASESFKRAVAQCNLDIGGKWDSKGIPFGGVWGKAPKKNLTQDEPLT